MRQKVLAQIFLSGLLAAGFIALSSEILSSDFRLQSVRESAIASRSAADAERLRLEALLDGAYAENANARKVIEELIVKVGKGNERTANARQVRDMTRDELRAANDRLELAYKDIAEMEKQLVDVSRAKNDIEQQNTELHFAERQARKRAGVLEMQLRGAGIEPETEPVVKDDDPAPEDDPTDVPRVDGVVLGISDKVNLVLVSVGRKDRVIKGCRFAVSRAGRYVSMLVVDKVEDGWAACRELTDSRKSPIEQGDKVSTRVR